MKDEIKYNLTTTNEWLRFAETKIAAIFAFNAAFIFGLISFFEKNKNTEILSQIVEYGMVASSIISISMCILGTQPITTERIEKPSEQGGSLTFYGSIANYTAENYIKKLYKATNKNCTYDEYEKNLAEQLITNSHIALRKFYYIKKSIHYLTASLTLFILYFFVFYQKAQ